MAQYEEPSSTPFTRSHLDIRAVRFAAVETAMPTNLRVSVNGRQARSAQVASFGCLVVVWGRTEVSA